MKRLCFCAALLAASLLAGATGKAQERHAPELSVFDMGDYGADCPNAPSAAVRHLYQEQAAQPHQRRFALRLHSLLAGHYDEVSCVYDKRRCALTATYTERFSGSTPIVSRLYRVTTAVLYGAAAREPEAWTGRALNYSLPFAFLLDYGATRTPRAAQHPLRPPFPLAPHTGGAKLFL